MMKIVTLVREKARLIHAAESRHLLREWRLYTKSSEESIYKIAKKRHDKIQISREIIKIINSSPFLEQMVDHR